MNAEAHHPEQEALQIAAGDGQPPLCHRACRVRVTDIWRHTPVLSSSAQIALDGSLSHWIHSDDSVRTSPHAGLAARAFFEGRQCDLKLLVEHNRIKSASRRAGRILTLLAGDRHIDAGGDLLHPDARPMRIKVSMVFSEHHNSQEWHPLQIPVPSQEAGWYR